MTSLALLEQLRDFPHIYKRVEFLWGTKECRQYLHSLTVTDRPKRRGFPFQAAVAITDLIELHDEQFPKYAPILSVWDQI